MTRARGRDLLLLYGLGVLLNTAVALLTRGPSYVDDFYYFNGGVMLASGQMRWPELLEPYFWNYVTAPPALPAPGFGYWQPLPSLLAALGITLLWFLPAFRAAQTVYVLLGGLLPPLAYLIAGRVGERRHALLAGLLAVFSGVYARYWSLPESFTPFALSAAGALLLAGAGASAKNRRAGLAWWLLAGGCAGLAHLTRADGVLVAGVVGFVALLPSSAYAGEQHARPLPRRVLGAVLVVVGYLLVMAPWFARNVMVFGAPLAPGGLDTLWLTEYNDLFNYPSNLSPGRYLAAGWGVMLGTKLRALLLNLATFVGVHNLVFLTPLTLLGWARRWRRVWMLPATLYAVALFSAMTFAFSLPGMRGGWLHSGAALVPFVMAMAALGLEDGIRWVAARRSSWQLDPAWRVFSAASVVLALFITGSMILTRVVQADYSLREAHQAIGAALDAAGVRGDIRVMVNNPPGFYGVTGHGGIPLVNGDEEDLLRAADDYGVQFVVLDQNVPDALRPPFENGPTTSRLEYVATFGEPCSPVSLYRILPSRASDS